MKRWSREIQVSVVLAGLIIISGGLALVHSLHKKIWFSSEQQTLVDATEQPVGTLDALSVDEVMVYIAPLIQSKSEEAIGTILAQLSFEKVTAVFARLLDPKQPQLEPASARDVLFYLLMQAGDNQQRVTQLLEFSLKYPQLWHNNPVRAAVKYYQSIIPVILQWAAAQRDKPDIDPALRNRLASLAYHAYQEAADHNMPDELEQLRAFGVPLTPEQATDLLWYAVEKKADPRFISFAQQQGGDIHAVREGKTLLIRAAQVNNINGARRLLELGLDPSQVVEPAIGSALQQATEKRFTELEVLLHGAQKKASLEK